MLQVLEPKATVVPLAFAAAHAAALEAFVALAARQATEQVAGSQAAVLATCVFRVLAPLKAQQPKAALDLPATAIVLAELPQMALPARTAFTDAHCFSQTRSGLALAIVR